MKTTKLFTTFTLILLGLSAQAQLSVSLSGNTTICLGMCTTLSATANSGTSPYIFSWTPSSGLSSSNISNPVACPTSSTSYTVVLTDANSNTATGTVTVVVNSLPSCAQNVWPGDCDYDLSANNFDFLNLGLAYGATGSARSGASNNWVAQPSADWSQGFASGGPNYKHSDCNGDGTVNASDTLAISLNYNKTHPFKLSPPIYNSALPDLYLIAQGGSVGSNMPVNVDIMLGTNVLPVDSIYGLAFTINYNPTYMLNPFSIDANFNSSWMGAIGTNMLSLQKNFFSSGMLDLGITRINHANALGGKGKIGTFSFHTTPVTSVSQGFIVFTISDVKAITATGSIISLNTISDSVYFMPNAGTGIEGYLNPDLVSIYPNPASENITLTLPSELKNVKMEMINLMGQTIVEKGIADPASKFDVSSLPAGMYQMKIICDEGVVIKKVQVGMK